MGVAAWLVWRSTATVRKRALALVAVQLGLNVAWSRLFFALRRIDLALVEMAALWVAIALILMAFAGASSAAAWLLAPYLAWVSFAAVLNAVLLRLNP
jgi:tryptophan-rich sensory protein